MSLNWNEIRLRAKTFADEFADATYEKGETQTFYNEFFDIFGIKRRQVARYEEHIKKLNDKSGFIDLFWPKVLLVEQKSTGRSLAKAGNQAGEYFDAIRDRDKPRFQLLCDFQTFELLDRDERETWTFTLAELPEKIDLFAFMIGREKRKFIDQDPVNIEASELMGAVHDDLEASGYTGHPLEAYLVRLLFMMFADDTGIFEPRDHLLDVIESRTGEDGSDLGMWLQRIFEVLNTPEDKRNANLDEDLNRFPYVNGDLFSENLPTADFSSITRERFLEACRFNWQAVSPAIFGSLFQSVMDPQERRKKGAHYTTEKNIMKVIGPLFLDDLRAEFEHLKGLRARKEHRLEDFRKRLGTLAFLDPACGCGNFLIISYRELRQLEIEVLQELSKFKNRDLFGGTISVLDVDQFYGIELEEFPARIAEAAMWMIDHIMNVQLGDAFGLIVTRIPLRKSPQIENDNALKIDWATLLPPHQCSYILGNPPFVGKHLRTDDQQEEMVEIFGEKGGAGKLDYVSAWFKKATDYVEEQQIKIGFVATNSITQGEQVNILWRQLFEAGIKLNFAHRTFAWGSDARGKAHVHCVIVGFSKTKTEKVRLFDYETPDSEPTEQSVGNINPYLIDYKDMLIVPRRKPLTDVSRIVYGSKPTDGGHLLLSDEEKDLILKNDIIAAEFVRPMLSADEFINGRLRWCLWLDKASPAQIKSSPTLSQRVKAVREFRLASTKLATQRDADEPQLFAEIRQPSVSFIAVPLHSSERRIYIPFGRMDEGFIVHNSCACVPDGSLALFGLMNSYMHMTWMRYTAGRIKSDYRYANILVYNTFPWPEMNAKKEARISELAQAVLDARDEFPDSTLADLYDPDLMPPVLRKAHLALDKAVDRLYRGKAFASERERVEHLFMLYEKMVAPIEAAAKIKPKRKRKKRKQKTD